MNGELISAEESRKLEAEADALLKQDARDQGFVIGRRPRLSEGELGFSAYARAYGITTKKTLETTYKHEAVGFTEQQLESLAHGSGMDNVVQSEDNREEA